MTRAVLVHGNPETSDIWGSLVARLHQDVETLSPPGFGAPVPEGFTATAAEYAAWLVSELEKGDGPADLVGHDWGGGHVMGVAMERPDLVRSWSIDMAGCFAPDYQWHALAQVWQTPGAGEESVAAMASMPVADRALRYESLGVTPPAALAMAAAYDETMGRCILALYRSAAQPALARVGEHLGLAAQRPGLVVIATEDAYTGGEGRARWAAQRAGAKVAVLAGLGHWWMLQDPGVAAATLQGFWSALE